MSNFITWLFKKRFAKYKKSVGALFVVLMPTFAAMVVYGIGYFCHTWPYPWAGLTYATTYFVYVILFFWAALEMSMNEPMKYWIPFGLQVLVACMYLFGMAVIWWP